jgi:hypothetical protein
MDGNHKLQACMRYIQHPQCQRLLAHFDELNYFGIIPWSCGATHSHEFFLKVSL